MEQGQTKQNSHEVRVVGREILFANGVLFVESFDDAALTISTVMGDMTVEGRALKIEEFSKDEGIVRICGEISGYYYNEQPREKKKLLERFLK